MRVMRELKKVGYAETDPPQPPTPTPHTQPLTHTHSSHWCGTITNTVCLTGDRSETVESRFGLLFFKPLFLSHTALLSHCSTVSLEQANTFSVSQAGEWRLESVCVCVQSQCSSVWQECTPAYRESYFACTVLYWRMRRVALYSVLLFLPLWLIDDTGSTESCLSQERREQKRREAIERNWGHRKKTKLNIFLWRIGNFK